MILVVPVDVQIRAKRFRPFLSWAAIVVGMTVGTTLANLTDRSLGADYLGGSLIHASIWRRTSAPLE